MNTSDGVDEFRLARRYSEVRVLEFLARRTVGAALCGEPPGPEGSIIKLAWSQAAQTLSRTATEAVGMDGLSGQWGKQLTAACSLTIAGGTTEVNKNIIAERVLGLPREPQPRPGA